MSRFYEETELWKRLYSAPNPSSEDIPHMERLRNSLDHFRDNAEVLASKIEKDLPGLTDHSVNHLDQLWRVASTILGRDAAFNPIEGFVFGGAILLHDLANSIAAMPDGIDELRGDVWNDLVTQAFIQESGERPSQADLDNPPKKITDFVIFERLRSVHAEKAEALACRGFSNPRNPSERLYLLEDAKLREEFGHLIGQIAASHHWPIEQVAKEFSDQKLLWSENSTWEIDALKVALLLRCSDAAHLDFTRATTLDFALRRVRGSSSEHWKFQNLLRPPRVDHSTQELTFTSIRPFEFTEREAWWLAFDSISQTVNREILESNRLLSEKGREPFVARSVAGAGNPISFARHVRVREWEPLDIRVKATDVASLVERFGGEKLYGSRPTAALKELLANSRDAICARRAIPHGAFGAKDGTLTVKVSEVDGEYWLEVEDDGVGMSEEVLLGPLLDFGASFWNSTLAVKEFPGLLSGSFRPVGRFGIGFFSVFMLGDTIEVTSRRFERAQQDTLVLEIQKDRKHQVLHRPTAIKTVRTGGTCVRVKLKNQPFNEGGLFDMTPSVTTRWSRRENKEHKLSEKLRAIGETVAFLAPASDVRILTQFIQGDESYQDSVSEPFDWQTLNFETLMTRIRGVRQAWDRQISDYVCEPTNEQGLLGRFRLLPEPRGSALIASMRGLRAEANGYAFLEGIVVGEDPALNRATAKVGIAREVIVAELKKAVAHGFLLQNKPLPHLAGFLLSYNITPTGLQCFEIVEPGGSTVAQTVDELREWIEAIEPGTELVLLCDEVFYYNDEFEREHEINIASELDRICPDCWILVTRPRSSYEFGSSDWDRFLYNYAIELLSNTWQIKAEEEIEVQSVDFGDLGGYSIQAECRVIVREVDC